MTALADFNSGKFLRDYWQREPLLLRSAIDFDNPLSPEELAGLALEDEVEARIVRQRGDRWELDSSPLDDSSFDGDSPWTLLVQAVDQWVPEVSSLRSLVDFLPNWRMDDVMVSYATDGGGVGPHYDNYDVFLLQGEGRRRWQLGQTCGADETLLDIEGLRILARFEAREEYLLEPGDILYVPPGVAHWGTAVGPCMTYSIGFRAPRMNDMLSRQADALLEQMPPELFYADAGIAPGGPGEITPEALASALSQLQSAVNALHAEADWFGELVTEPRTPADPPPLAAPLPGTVSIDASSRVAWRSRANDLAVYANGETLFAAVGCRPLLELLCRGERVTRDGLDGDCAALLRTLWNSGCLADD